MCPLLFSPEVEGIKIEFKIESEKPGPEEFVERKLRL